MSCRITFNLTADGSFEIWLNEAGRDLLVRKLQNLNETSDHIHFGPDDNGEIQVSSRPYRPEDKMLLYGKCSFRPDEWDRKYFPHVMENESDAGDIDSK